MSVLVQAGKAASTGLDWTAISAVATGFAAVVALVVGVMPVLIDRGAKKRQAAALVRLLANDLTIQAINVRAVMEVPFEGIADSWQYSQMTRALSVISSAQARELIPFTQYLPRSVEVEVTKVVATLSAAEMRRVHLFDFEPGQRYSVKGDLGWYRDVADTLLSTRSVLSKWLKVDLVDIDKPARDLAEGLRANAAADRVGWLGAKKLAKPVKGEEQD